jgi:DNA-binding response OmpR family regulator
MLGERTAPRVLLLEPNAALRSAVQAVLAAENYEVQTCSSLEEVLMHGAGFAAVALVAWQSMEGLLAEEQRHQLMELTGRIRLVLMVPRRWARLLERSEVGTAVAGLVAKPFEADELLHTVQRALNSTTTVDA